jgi:hypothetical protein
MEGWKNGEGVQNVETVKSVEDVETFKAGNREKSKNGKAGRCRRRIPTSSRLRRTRWRAEGDRIRKGNDGKMEFWNGETEDRRRIRAIQVVQVVEIVEIVKAGKIEELDDQDKRGPGRGSTGFFV